MYDPLPNPKQYLKYLLGFSGVTLLFLSLLVQKLMILMSLLMLQKKEILS